jgi:oxygen-independent coproporphyrinogen-3 oxidase
VYCDFAVEVRREGGTAEWLEALAGELAVLDRREGALLASDLDTLYVGGGTPSLLGPRAMWGLSEVVGVHRLGAACLEWTAEANPESLSAEVAAEWKAAGVTRISVGAQSFHPGALRWMGRLHGPDGVGVAVESARGAGFEDISVDLIFGLPGHLGRSWAEDLARTLELAPEHVSLYGLTVESSTPLGRAVREGREDPVDEERYREEYLLAAEILAGAGFEHYEVSNFARPGHASRHNQAYWSGQPYLGLGNGAHSYVHPVRRWNQRSWPQYRGAVLAGRSPEAGREVLGEEAIRLERVWLSLRTSRGFTAEGLPPRASALLSRWTHAGLATRCGGRVRLTAEGWLVLDQLAVELDACLSG